MARARMSASARGLVNTSRGAKLLIDGVVHRAAHGGDAFVEPHARRGALLRPCTAQA